MNISISEIDEFQNYKELLFFEVLESDGAFNIEKTNGFIFDGCKYNISGKFMLDSKKGNLVFEKDGHALVRMLLTLDPTFLITVKIDEKRSLELNLSI